jgi:hypothetical protein
MHKIIHNLFVGTSMRVQTRLLEILRIFLGRRRVEFLRLAPGGEGIEDKKKEEETRNDEEEEEEKEEEGVVVRDQVLGETAGSVSVSSNCRKHIASGWNFGIGCWKFCAGAASSNRGRLTISRLYGSYLVIPRSTPYQEQEDTTYFSVTDAKEALLLFPIVSVAAITDALEYYMNNRYASLEQEALQQLEEEDENDRRTSRRRNKKKVDAEKLIAEDKVLNLYARCKLGNMNASFMLLEYIRHYPPRFHDSVSPPQWVSPASQRPEDDSTPVPSMSGNFKGFMYSPNNSYTKI